jgi:DNA-binding response OmpR family regulator
MKILLIEDNIDLASGIDKYLSDEGYRCELSCTVEQAMEKIQLYEYDCIVLDISLPDGNGFKILEKTKKMGRQEGIIIISAKDSLDDKLKGLMTGADDYLTKPFHLPELAMRVMAIIRRKKFSGNNSIEYGAIRIDLIEKEVFCFEKLVDHLTPKELDLLLLFISSPHRVLSKSSIAEHLAGDHADMLDNFDFVYAHVKNLKKKLQQSGCPNYIHTVYGMGYKFEINRK